MSYGPSLPPHLQKKRDQESSESEEDSNFGPALPPGFKKGQKEDKKEESKKSDSDSDDNYGPALPPGFKRDPKESKESSEDEEEDFGPALPPGFKREDKKPDEEEKPAEDSSDDDDVIGPMPPKPGEGRSTAESAAAAIEARSKKMLDKIEGRTETAEPKRESWMLEMPPEKAKNFGLGPRQFAKTSKAPTPRSERAAWTDTPEMAAKRARGEIPDEGEAKEDDKDVLEYLASIKRDEEMDKISKKLREKRGEKSLMDMHDKKLQDDFKKTGKKLATAVSTRTADGERREFDRDLDLQANRFDAAQKAQMLKRAAQLNDRFSSGGRKYL